MSKLTYWENRQVQNMYNYMQSAENAADQIAELYYRASRYLSYSADDIFEKFQTKYGLSDAEARRLINTLHDKTSLDELQQRLKNVETSAEIQEILKELEAPAYQARLERLRQLQNSLDLVMQTVYQQEKILSTNFYVDLANEAYYREIFNIQQQADAAFGFNCVSEKQIDQMLDSEWSGKNYSARIWTNTQNLAKTLKEELLFDLVTGRTNRETAEIIANKFGQGASKARRLVRTESNYVSSEMNFAAYEECGIKEYQFLATLDLRTSKVCRELDGKIFPVKDRKVGVNCNPMHPWCRSTTISVVDRELAADMQRSAVDPSTGKRIKVPRSMTYEQWYEKYVKGKPEAELEEKKLKNKTSDWKEHQKYREILGKNIPESLAEFQDIKYTDNEKWNQIKGDKEETLKLMDYNDMENLKGKLTNKEVREWYKTHDENIFAMIDKTKSLREQAVQAFELRNKHRTQARELMQDTAARKELEKIRKNPTFEELMEHKRKKYGLTDEEAYEDIIRSSATTNKRYDRIAGIERKEGE